jgi:nucleoside-diphosphate-sugar epimerase
MSELVDWVKSGRWAWMNHGHHLVSTCHVGNLTEGIMRTLEHGHGGHCYFVTDGAPIDYRNFVSNLLKTQGLNEPNGHISGRWAMWSAWTMEFIIRRLSLDIRPQLTRTQVALMRHELTINDNKARNDLGYQGRITREDGMADLARRKRNTSFG